MTRSRTPETAGENAAEAKKMARRYSVDDIFVPHDPGPWPEGFRCSREEIYADGGYVGRLKKARPRRT